MGYFKNQLIETEDGLRNAADEFVRQAAPFLSMLCDENAGELMLIWEETRDDLDECMFDGTLDAPMGRQDIGYARELADALHSFVIITTENDR